MQKSSNACNVFNGRKQCMTPPVDLKVPVECSELFSPPKKDRNFASGVQSSKRKISSKNLVHQKWVQQFWTCRFFFVPGLEEGPRLESVATSETTPLPKHSLCEEFASMRCGEDIPNA